MKIRMWALLLTTIRKARNHFQDEDHCQYHLHLLLQYLVYMKAILVGIEKGIKSIRMYYQQLFTAYLANYINQIQRLLIIDRIYFYNCVMCLF